MKIIGIIPARYASTRFPGKPLADILGKPMIRHVYERAIQAGSLDGLYVATDDDRIYRAVEQFGGKVCMTSKDHASGTDRCEEVAGILSREGVDADIVINIQGDEPGIHPEQLDLLSGLFSDPEVGIATLAKRITSAEELFSTTVNKVILDRNGDAVYFSRSPIPHIQGREKQEWPRHFNFLKHIGIYAYRREILRKITQLPRSGLEISESLEQLRWIENGYRIRVGITTLESLSIDTPDDLSKFTNMS